MAFRNPNEGMASFLGNIGNMRRTWEQENRVKEADARAAEQHQTAMKQAAQQMAIAQTAEERAIAEANARRLLDPLQRQEYTTRITGNELENAGRRTQNKASEWRFGFDQTELPAQAKRAAEAHTKGLALTDSQIASEGTQRRLNNLKIGEAESQAAWQKAMDAVKVPGSGWTYGHARGVGGVDKLPTFIQREVDMQNYRFLNQQLLQSIKEGMVSPTQVAALNEVGSRLGIPAMSAEEFAQQAGLQRGIAGTNDYATGIVSRGLGALGPRDGK